ncbi:DUF2490 domain-containing protein [Flavobacterium quisquiliarum]|uniref:DUF2490 domain-containing protein n=1 Tax=Flavobacterium quisquiliarum TaxID=1834436 RepID=A0ABV8WE18_9FLAO|nr:DUF2490 domain-containing protein [Flavobacterium quisquiliarum]MBW1657630.1 DUF2490 domain-containing protein [Flavobacterium quisquiliarum]NWL00086.1 DUF2490 domain-containing protein [Flavobacterium collinsii]
MLSKSNPKRINNIVRCLFVILMITNSYGQNTTYSQFWNEIQFSRTLSEKWSTEIDLGATYSSTESSSNLFDNTIQRSVRGWGHYYFSPRWKFSSFIAYFNNKDVPEIGQFKSPEWRFALQGIYFFHKTGYTLSTRMRMEFRHMRNQDEDYENVFRYRQQIKYLQPITSKVLREGVIYAVASDEICLKSGAKVTGESFFDRNRFMAGAGYLFSDDIQVELTYCNEFLPRNNGNQTTNAASLTISFNNFLDNLKKKINSKHNHEIKDEE